MQPLDAFFVFHHINGDVHVIIHANWFCIFAHSQLHQVARDVNSMHIHSAVPLAVQTRRSPSFFPPAPACRAHLFRINRRSMQRLVCTQLAKTERSACCAPGVGLFVPAVSWSNNNAAFFSGNSIAFHIRW